MKDAGTNASRGTRQGLLMTGASVLTLLAATAAQAQDGAQPATEAEQEVVVTGSRIASPALTSPSPLQVVTAQALENSGVVNVQEALQQNPAVGIPGQSRTTNGGSTNPGLATGHQRPASKAAKAWCSCLRLRVSAHRIGRPARAARSTA